MMRCSLKFNPQSVIRYQQFALWVKMSNSEQIDFYGLPGPREVINSAPGSAEKVMSHRE